MSNEWTLDQRKVIDTRDKDILVSAAAGSGKTAVLVERIVEMICDPEKPVDIDRLLVVTFTKAAAAEMRERIAEAISEKTKANPESEQLARQAVLLHNAKICTIDSFCSQVLRNNFDKADVEPGYRTPDEAEITLIRRDVLADLLEERFSETDPDKLQAFKDCVEFFCPNVNEDKLEDIVINLYKASQSDPFPQKWFDEKMAEPIPSNEEEFVNAPFVKNYMAKLRQELKRALTKYEEAIALVQSPDGPYMYGEVLDAEKEVVERALSCDDDIKMTSVIGTIEFNKLPGKKDDSVNPGKKTRAKNLRDEAKETVKAVNENNPLGNIPVSLRKEQACMTQSKAMLSLALKFSENYEECKRDKHIMEFTDVAHAALNILVDGIDDSGNPIPSATANAMAAEIDEILVDEYQDTNYIQEYIIKALRAGKEGHRNVFMVGDVKQSIYRFRQAKPDLFMGKYKDYAAENEDNVRIDLKQNFRSRKEVLKITNDIFSKIMDENFGGISYDSDAALYPNPKSEYTENPECTPELILTLKADENDKSKTRERNMIAIADRINSLVGAFDVYDKKQKKTRKAKYSDVVVLLRGLSSWGDSIRKVFDAKGIPYYAESSGGYYETSEIENAMHFLKVIDNPTRNVAMMGALKSRFGGFNDEEIAKVRCVTTDKLGTSIYKNLKDALNNDGLEKDLQEKIQIFLQRLQLYRKMSTYMGVRELLSRIFEDFNYPEYVAALPAGERRIANVHMLLEKAGSFEESSYHGIFHFVRYVEQLKKYKTDEGEAGLSDENANVVRIMTIHKSKGLEFPITFIGGMDVDYNETDAKDNFVIDDNLGIGAGYMDTDRRVKSGSIHKKMISDRIVADGRAEELRVLYVAMTRAKEKLIMVGDAESKESLKKTLESCISLRNRDTWRIPAGELSKRNYLSYILMALISHPSMEKLLDELEIERTEAVDLKCPYSFDWEEQEEDLKISTVETGEADEAGIDYAIELETARRKLINDIEKGEADRDFYDELITRFKYVYPHEDLKELYTKTSVSELKMAALAEEGEPVKELFTETERKPYIPRFKRGDTGVSGTTRGSAFHKAMELLDFAAITGSPSDKASRAKMIERLLDSYMDEGKLSEEYRQAVVVDRIVAFFDTDLARRMGEAHKKGLLYREQPFVYGISASKLNPGFPSGERILIQGIIDAFFIEEGKIVLMDYKTDVIDSENSLIDRYRIQLDYYRDAIESGRGMKVSDIFIYSSHFAKAIALD